MPIALPDFVGGNTADADTARNLKPDTHAIESYTGLVFSPDGKYFYLFGPDREAKFVTHFFPFTEPSAEMIVHFNGQWMELGGCGMFHPRVLEMAGIDPARYTAFAFGLGVERTTAWICGIEHIRETIAFEGIDPDARDLARRPAALHETREHQRFDVRR